MSDDALEVLDGDVVVDAPERSGHKPLTASQRRMAKLAASIQDEVSTAVMGGETVDELRKRLDWARKTRPANQGIWRRATILALAATGMTTPEIADLVDLAPATVKAALYDLRRTGLGIDVTDRLDHDILPEAVTQLSKMVTGGDKDAVFAVLKGRGAFRQHVAGEGQGRGPMTVLAVKFEMPPGMQPSMVGTIVGKPREDT